MAPLKVEWDGGVSVSYGDTTVIFDPQKSIRSPSKVFVTHAHLDHAGASSRLNSEKYSTKETIDLLEAYRRRTGWWRPISYRETVKVGDLEVKAHNAGHVLGSSLYEVISPEGTVVYTGDFQFRDTFTLEAAEAVPCDILVLEATFGSPSFIFPEREKVASEMVRWALDLLRRGKTPMFRADSLGNAQEIIKAFNMLTDVPVIVHPSIAKISKVYRTYGCHLEFLSLNSEIVDEALSSSDGVLVVPKNVKFGDPSRFETALVSGWALWFRGRGGASFALSDHADFQQLMEFVESCKPRVVLTCFSERFEKTLAAHIARKFRIEARPLKLIRNEIYVNSRPSYLKEAGHKAR